MTNNSGVLLVRKEQNMTSFDVCRKLQKVFFTKQIGHTGTLDPNATGLLVVLINKATKILPYLKNDRKTYVAELTLGYSTDTGDIWGEKQEEKDFMPLKREKAEELLNSFLGKQQQLPPMYSAIKVKGKKLYEYARDHEEVEREPREIEVFSMNLISVSENTMYFEAEVSSGTYIRTLCEDIAKKYGTLGVMSSLKRTKVGSFSLEDAHALSEITLQTELLDMADLLPFSYVEYDRPADLFNGRDIILSGHEEERLLVGHEGKGLAVYRRLNYDRYHCERGLW